MYLPIHDYTYNLPAEKIALYPLEKRDESKLLVYQNGEIRHSTFLSLTDFLPKNAFLFFNDTKVIPARLHFKKQTGADIEIFLLSPVKPSPLVIEAMEARKSVTWKCTIGNMKRWTDGMVLEKTIHSGVLQATMTSREEGLVQFQWNTDQPFAEIINLSGETPLPPYLNRPAETDDRERYQTIYSHHEGAVAAPTAGLHFTDTIFQSLQKRNIEYDYLTLHVSAGTFQPVKVENATEHVMHREQVVVNRRNLENLMKPNRSIVAVGTTSMRTLESLYWFGVKLLHDPEAPFVINQQEAYKHAQHSVPAAEEALQAVASYMDNHQIEMLTGETSIYIMPGYSFKICKGLVTNFHQPGSTLMLLVAAFVGNEWRKIYQEALTQHYRFLSYGDSSLLLP
ncbi:MAG: S-adenosylmethionine:tRNA ribosyltransferase-isomerase [Cyclobacteriaceae bacterium]|nr:S-adenosylmethionine:tRNA ribosyltransferase-isomerase [Cyclobacteriaceae bacterium]